MTPEVAKALAEAGPWAVVIFIGAMAAITGTRAIMTLWKHHLEADADDRHGRDEALRLLQTSVDANREAATAQKLMAAAWDERNRIDNERNRADAARRRKVDS